MKNDDEIISTFLLLDNGSQSTLVREDFAKYPNLKRYSRTINITRTKDEPESVNVKEITLKICHMDDKNEVEVDAYTLTKIMFNMPSQSAPNMETTRIHFTIYKIYLKYLKYVRQK